MSNRTDGIKRGTDSSPTARDGCVVARVQSICPRADTRLVQESGRFFTTSKTCGEAHVVMATKNPLPKKGDTTTSG